MSYKVLNVSVQFVEPSLEGKDLSEVARYYRPHLRVQDEHLTSCFFDGIGDGRGPMKLGVFYLTTINLRMAKEMEVFFGKTLEEIFPEGREIEILALDKLVAHGTSLGVFEAS